MKNFKAIALAATLALAAFTTGHEAKATTILCDKALEVNYAGTCYAPGTGDAFQNAQAWAEGQGPIEITQPFSDINRANAPTAANTTAEAWAWNHMMGGAARRANEQRDMRAMCSSFGLGYVGSGDECYSYNR